MSLERIEISLVVLFGDDEDWIGSIVHQANSHFENAGMSSEILALDLDSGDNSHAILAILCNEYSNLQVLPENATLCDAASQARGKILWIIGGKADQSALSDLDEATSDVLRHADLVRVSSTLTVCRREPTLPVLRNQRGLEHLVELSRQHGLTVMDHSESSSLNSSSARWFSGGFNVFRFLGIMSALLACFSSPL